MQAHSLIFENDPYTAEMAGRPTTKEAPLFGQRLAALRKQRGWTQADLAQRLKTTVKMVTYYEREATNPTSKTVETIARVFGISSAELMGHPPLKTGAHKPGPPSHLQQLTQRLTKLPRHKQKVVIEMLEGLLPKA